MNSFLDNLSQHLKNTIARAISLSSSFGHDMVTPLHLLYAMVEEPGALGAEILKKMSLQKQTLLYFLEHLTPKSKNPPKAEQAGETTTLPSLSDDAKQILEKAMLTAYEYGHSHVGTEHLLYGLTQSTDTDIQYIFAKHTAKKENLVEYITNMLQNLSRFPNVKEIAEAAADLQASNQDPRLAGVSKEAKKTLGAQKKNPTALDIFTINLTDKKTQEKIDPVIGREAEIERVIHILCRRNKNNPVLVGEPGVGKTAIAEGLAKRIAEGAVPDILKNKKILSLDLTLLIAGTIYRGEFESRLKQIIEEVGQDPNCILFIDEIHNIIGAGSNQGTMDAANILKPALARGNLRCIGATTIDEYKKHISSDPALERRLQAIPVEEPTPAQTISILHGLKKYYEQFHQTRITDEAIAAAVEYSEKYVHDNFLPDKAIDLIDEAAAAVRSTYTMTDTEKKIHKLMEDQLQYEQKKDIALANEELEEAMKSKGIMETLEKKIAKLTAALPKKIRFTKKVTRSNIAAVIGHKLHIPPTAIEESEWERLRFLESRLTDHIVGQDEAIATVVETLKRSHIRSGTNKKPFASFLFAGPSGVGKTELAKRLAKELYFDDAALVKLDMSEFSEQHSTSKLLGSPAGYIGYKDRNRFIDAIRKRPYSVLVFDEIDKAHPDVMTLLLQILDEGQLTDSNGKKTFFTHAIIILTTNRAAEAFRTGDIGFGNEKGVRVQEKAILTKLKEEFSPAIFERLDAVCLFPPLTEEHIQTIIQKHVQALTAHLASTKRGVVRLDQKAIDALIKDIWKDHSGARHIERRVEKMIYETMGRTLVHKKKQTYG